MVENFPKHSTINFLGYFVKKKLQFHFPSETSLSTVLHNGFISYSVDVPKFGMPTTLWLGLSDGRVLRVRAEMHDLSGWDEIGTLTFDVTSTKDKNEPKMIALAASWSKVSEVEKLIYKSDECVAESGFTMRTATGESLTVLPGANVYTLAIDSPFLPLLFEPENDFKVYHREKF
jgi:hypothetical protein